jgi:hypothetical protein
MKKAKLIVVKTATVARGSSYTGPFDIEAEVDFKALIQKRFTEDLKGAAGYVLVAFNGKLFQCERDPVDPSKPYVRHVVKYHPLAKLFTSQKAS